MKWACTVLVAAGLFGGAVSHSYAADAAAGPYEPCALGEMNKDLACYTQAFAEQDKALNAIYSKYSAILSPYQRQALQAAERSWVRFRDADCQSAGLFIAYEAFPGDILLDQKNQKAKCLATETHARVVVLQARYKLQASYARLDAPSKKKHARH